jgi:malonate decarboxylase holo-[acyl-carrier-protein] synthase
MLMERHGLIMLSTDAAQRIAIRVWNEWFKQHNLSQSEWYLSLLNGLIPAIVRRGTEQEHQHGIPVGVSLPIRWQNQRLRLAECLRENEAVRYVTPYQIAPLPFLATTASLQTFSQLYQHWPLKKDQLGVWGSNALQIITGLSYTDSRSDLDVLVRSELYSELAAVHSIVTELEQKNSIKIDVEIALNNGYGINLKELLQPGKRILAKGLNDVLLINKSELNIG